MLIKNNTLIIFKTLNLNALSQAITNPTIDKYDYHVGLITSNFVKHDTRYYNVVTADNQTFKFDKTVVSENEIVKLNNL